MLAPGAKVGNYVVEEEIGGGGMARLYRVRHSVLGSHHAMKVLDASFREMPEVRARFLSEGMIAAKLNHPNVVKVTDAVSTPEVAGLIMDFVEGPSLEQYIRARTTRPTVAEVHAIFLPVLDAVGEAHRHGIIHRDLKPANILLERRERGYVPKVTDFGIAKVTESPTGLVVKKGSTRAEARMGTLNYMSPEQVRGARNVTVRSDIFSLGATLYELATGVVAYDGPSDYDVMEKIVHGSHRAVEAYTGLDPSITYAIERALQTDPACRFGSCEEFRDALTGPAVQPMPYPAASSTSQRHAVVGPPQAPPLPAGQFGYQPGLSAAMPAYSPTGSTGPFPLVAPQTIGTMPAYGIPAMPPGYVPTAAKTSGLAIAGLICSLACTPVGFILSIIALVKINTSKGTLKGAGFAWAGIALCVVWVLIALASS